jgi:hypothetical protein
MFEVKHFGFNERGQWITLRGLVREYSTLLDAYAQAQAWVDQDGGQAQVYEGDRLINVYSDGGFWR